MKALHVLSVLALVGCVDANAPTSSAQQILGPTRKLGDVLVNDRTPADFGMSACNGEWVPLSGELHYVVAVTQSTNGSTNTKVFTDYTFSGVGSVTGAKYQGGLKFVDKEKFGPGEANVFSVDISLRLIGQGNIPNTWLDASTAFTIDANGNVTHDNPTYTARCS